MSSCTHFQPNAHNAHSHGQNNTSPPNTQLTPTAPQRSTHEPAHARTTEQPAAQPPHTTGHGTSLCSARSGAREQCSQCCPALRRAVRVRLAVEVSDADAVRKRSPARRPAHSACYGGYSMGGERKGRGGQSSHKVGGLIAWDDHLSWARTIAALVEARGGEQKAGVALQSTLAGQSGGKCSAGR